MTPDQSEYDENDRPLDDAVIAAASAYHEPPTSVPREEMWAAIQASRAAREVTPPVVGRIDVAGSSRATRLFRAGGWPSLAAAAVLVLALGTSFGWWLHSRTIPHAHDGAPLASAATGVSSDIAYRITVVRDLAQAEALLTSYRSDGASSGGQSDAALAGWARAVLSDTRLLLDSPAGADPARRQLLEDLELVLIQLTPAGSAGGADAATDRAMVNRAIDRAHILTRLRAAVPAGTSGI